MFHLTVIAFATFKLSAQSGWLLQKPTGQAQYYYTDKVKETNFWFLNGFELKFISRNNRLFQTNKTIGYGFELEFNSVNSTLVSDKLIWEPFDLKTIVFQGTLGLGLGALILLPKTQDNDYIGIILQASATIIVVPLAIYFTGEILDGDGSYLLTLLGSLLGGGIALLPNVIKGTGDQQNAKLLSLILSVVASVLGYHLSATPVYETNEPQSNGINNEINASINSQDFNGTPICFQITLVSLPF